MNEKGRLNYAKDVLISLLAGYSMTFLGIVILALFLLLLQISENMVEIGIIIIYVFSCLLAGFIIGKRTKNRKFLWGMLSGGTYFLLLFILSLTVRQGMENVGNDLVTVFFICIGSGTLGGMIS